MSLPRFQTSKHTEHDIHTKKRLALSLNDEHKRKLIFSCSHGSILKNYPKINTGKHIVCLMNFPGLKNYTTAVSVLIKSLHNALHKKRTFAVLQDNNYKEFLEVVRETLIEDFPLSSTLFCSLFLDREPFQDRKRVRIANLNSNDATYTEYNPNDSQKTENNVFFSIYMEGYRWFIKYKNKEKSNVVIKINKYSKVDHRNNIVTQVDEDVFLDDKEDLILMNDSIITVQFHDTEIKYIVSLNKLFNRFTYGNYFPFIEIFNENTMIHDMNLTYDLGEYPNHLYDGVFTLNESKSLNKSKRFLTDTILTTGDNKK